VAGCRIIYTKDEVQCRLVDGQEINATTVVTLNELLGDKFSLLRQIALTENNDGRPIDLADHEPIRKPLEQIRLEHFSPRHGVLSLQYLLHVQP